jgi:hypothetical protein
LFDHVPFEAVNVWPDCGVPLTVGVAVFAGAAVRGCTTSLGCEMAELEPPEFAAVTTTRSRLPMSPAVAIRTFDVSPGTFAQEVPDALHRCHWYA